MILAFTLSMPVAASWNGRWSGEDRWYAKTREVDAEKGAAIIAGARGDYTYRWDDGWVARVSVSEASEKHAKEIAKNSNGFCGYDWMIDSIVKHGKILDEQLEQQLADVTSSN